MSQQIEVVKLIFDAATKPEMFGLTVQRGEEIVEGINEITQHVVTNYKEKYMILGTGENEGQHRLDDGRVTQLFLELAKTQQEWLFLLYVSSGMCDEIRFFLRSSRDLGLITSMIKAVR